MDNLFEKGFPTFSTSELPMFLAEQPPKLTECPEAISFKQTPLYQWLLDFDREVAKRTVAEAKANAAIAVGDDRFTRTLQREMRQIAFRREYYQVIYWGLSGKILHISEINPGSDSRVGDPRYDEIPNALGVMIIHNHHGENPFSQGDIAHIIGRTAIASNPDETDLARIIDEKIATRFLSAFVVGDTGFHLTTPTIESVKTWGDNLQLAGRVGKAAGDWEEWRRGVNTENWRILKQKYDLGNFEGPRFAHAAAIKDLYPEEANNRGVAILNAMLVLQLSDQLSFPVYFAPKKEFSNTGGLRRAREITDYFPELNKLRLPDSSK